MTVSSGDSVSVSLTDEVIEKSLNAYVKAKAKLETSKQEEENKAFENVGGDLLAQRKEDIRKNLSVIEGAVPKTRANEAIQVIRQTLREKKV